MIPFRSKTKGAILNYFFLNESRKVYVNKLARLLKEDPKNVYCALIGFEKEGILKSEFQGRERYFSANRENPLYKNYKALFLKTAGLEFILKNSLSKIAGLSQVYIFGSYAKNALTAESDIDLLLVGGHSVLETEKALYAIQEKIGREINAVHLKREELEQKKKSKDPFIANIFKNPMVKIL
jgi:predicted nucleotidyltransferase